MKHFKKWFLALTIMFGLSLPAWATDPTYGDPTTLVTTAETLFASVSAFVVAVVGFWILVSIVKGVKRK